MPANFNSDLFDDEETAVRSLPDYAPSTACRETVQIRRVVPSQADQSQVGEYDYHRARRAASGSRPRRSPSPRLEPGARTAILNPQYKHQSQPPSIPALPVASDTPTWTAADDGPSALSYPTEDLGPDAAAASWDSPYVASASGSYPIESAASQAGGSPWASSYDTSASGSYPIDDGASSSWASSYDTPATGSPPWHDGAPTTEELSRPSSYATRAPGSYPIHDGASSTGETSWASSYDTPATGSPPWHDGAPTTEELSRPSSYATRAPGSYPIDDGASQAGETSWASSYDTPVSDVYPTADGASQTGETSWSSSHEMSAPDSQAGYEDGSSRGESSWQSSQQDERADSEASQDDVVSALSLVRRFALQSDLTAATRILCDGIEQLLGCKRVHCLTSDPLSGEPWALANADDSIAAFAASGGEQVVAQPATTCSRYRAEVDDAKGSGAENVVAQPIMAGGGVIAVVMAIRAPGASLFGQRELSLLTMLAEQCGPLLLHAVHNQAQRRTETPQGNGLFRGQALENHRNSRKDGALLELSPSWIRIVYPSVLLALLGGFAYGFVAHVDQYSMGVAVIKLEGVDVTARTSGTVAKTFAVAGQQVEKGELIVQLHADAEDAELLEINKQYEQQMAAFLFDPSNGEARSALAQIKARKQKAEKMLGDRTIRAPKAGFVADLRVEPGRRLNVGDFVFAISEKDAMPEIVAFLPGGDRPRLRRGQEIQLRLPGFEKANERAVITSVGQEVIGASEAKSFLGRKNGDQLPVSGPVVIVRAKLPSRTFITSDKTYKYFDGQPAFAEVSVKSRRALVALLPALEKWL